jgi:hypothetical protein
MREVVPVSLENMAHVTEAEFVSPTCGALVKFVSAPANLGQSSRLAGVVPIDRKIETPQLPLSMISTRSKTVSTSSSLQVKEQASSSLMLTS